jgi:hypothetical protein
VKMIKLLERGQAQHIFDMILLAQIFTRIPFYNLRRVLLRFTNLPFE